MKTGTPYDTLIETINENNPKGLAIKQISTQITAGKRTQSISLIEYDEEDREIKRKIITTNPDGQSNEMVIIKKFDHCGELIKMLTQGTGFSNLMEINIIYGEKCQKASSSTIVNKNISNSRSSYTYDSDGRLSRTMTESYDLSGNVTATTLSKSIYDSNGLAIRHENTTNNKNTINKSTVEIEYVSFDN